MSPLKKKKKKVKPFRDLSQDDINNFSHVLREFTNNFIVNKNYDVNI